MTNFPNIQKMQRNLWLFGWLKIPMIGFCRPKIIEWDEQKVVIRIKQSRRTQNHLNAIYFGALMIGADLAAGLHAFALARENDKKISLAFKSCAAEFHQRPEGHAYFKTESGDFVLQMILESEKTKERVNRIVPVTVTDTQGNLVAKIDMELSIKVK
jgi:acyl-coenzyme A thioesterase PaaI-like protein